MHTSPQPAPSLLHTIETLPGLTRWGVDDDVVQLREWGSSRVHRLPTPPSLNQEGTCGDWLIGSAEECYVRLSDPSRQVSRRHARLMRDRLGWTLLDLGSKNGFRLDGAPQVVATLEPGAEVEFGSVLLMAESPKLIALRQFVARILGWAPERMGAVDEALRAIRSARLRRAPLVIRGEGDLVTIALDLHRRMVDADRPFVLCGPRRPSVDCNLRGIAATEQGLAALAAARGGTLCIRGQRRPLDFVRVALALHAPSCRTQLILCDESRAEPESALALPITLPSLLARHEEVPRIIEEYCTDAALTLGLRRPETVMQIREWIALHSAANLPAIERAAYRLTALQVFRTVEESARSLDIPAEMLRTWMNRHDVAAPAEQG